MERYLSFNCRQFISFEYTLSYVIKLFNIQHTVVCPCASIFFSLTSLRTDFRNSGTDADKTSLIYVFEFLLSRFIQEKSTSSHADLCENPTRIAKLPAVCIGEITETSKMSVGTTLHLRVFLCSCITSESVCL